MIFKQTISELQDIYKRKYYNNFRLIARRFETYDKIGGFYNEEIDDTATLTGYLCTCVDPSTYDVNGREIAITLEKGGGKVWYDGVASEFTIDDFTNSDSGFFYYKIVDATNSITYYSELIYCDYFGIYGIQLTVLVRVTEPVGSSSQVVDVPVTTAEVYFNEQKNTYKSDALGLVSVPENTFGFYTFQLLAGSFSYDTGLNTGLAEWEAQDGDITLNSGTIGTLKDWAVKGIAELDVIATEIDLTSANFILFTGQVAELYLGNTGFVIWNASNIVEVTTATDYTFDYGSPVVDQVIGLNSITIIRTPNSGFEIDLDDLIGLDFTELNLTDSFLTTGSNTLNNFNSANIQQLTNLEKLFLGDLEDGQGNYVDGSDLSTFVNLDQLVLIGKAVYFTSSDFQDLSGLTILSLTLGGNVTGGQRVTMSAGDFSGYSSLTNLILSDAFGQIMSINLDETDIAGMTSLNLLQLTHGSFISGSQLTFADGSAIWSSSISSITIAYLMKTSTDVDNMIIGLAASTIPDSGTLTLTGNSARTSASDAAIATLTGKSWTINIS